MSNRCSLKYSIRSYLAIAILPSLFLATSSHAAGLCMQPGFNLAYDSLPSEVVSCLALKIDDPSQPPVSSKLESKSIYDNPYAYANLVWECTTDAGHDAAALFDTYLADAFAQTKNYCKESLDFEVEQKAFEELVFGKYSETGSNPGDEKIAPNMKAPLTLGRGRATEDQIDDCMIHGAQQTGAVLAEQAGPCLDHMTEKDIDEEKILTCFADNGISQSEFTQAVNSQLVEHAGNQCIIRHNYRMTAADFQNLERALEKMGSENQSYREAAEFTRRFILESKSK